MSNLDLIRGRQVVLPLTNKSGGGRVEGEVVIVDTATDDSFTRIAAEGSELVIGVVAETIANNAEGRVICGGYVAIVDMDAATARGDYLKTSATAGDATPTATMDAGVFGVALSAVGGAGQVSAYLFGVDSGTGAGDWTLIQDTELGAPAATIDFVAIPATYKHLAIVGSLRSDRAGQSTDVLIMRFNNSAVGYDWREFQDPGGGSEGINSTYLRAGLLTAPLAPAGSFAGVTIYVHDYLDAAKMASAETKGGSIRLQVAGNLYVTQTFGVWRTLTAVNRITLLPLLGANFIAASRASLYGIS